MKSGQLVALCTGRHIETNVGIFHPLSYSSPPFKYPPPSLAVSIKMNVLLFSPGLLVVYLLSLGWQGTLFQLAVCAVVQGVLGAPFIISNPVAYITGAFNFGRVFLFEWTVNWRMLPEWVFLSKTFHVVLLLLHLVVLLLFALKHWTR